MKFVIYEGAGEIIVTSASREKRMLKEFFTEAGRSLDEYDRSESSECAITIISDLRMHHY